MSTPMLIDSPSRRTNPRQSPHPAHSLVPGPGRDAQAAATDHSADGPALWSDDESWDDEDLYTPAGSYSDTPAPTPDPARTPTPASAPRPASEPTPAPAARPPHCSVPPRRSVALFPTIRAGGGRHRLPSPVRRRPGPIAAGLMVAATTLAAGSLRLAAPPATPTAAGIALQCAPIRPGESCG